MTEKCGTCPSAPTPAVMLVAQVVVVVVSEDALNLRRKPALSAVAILLILGLLVVGLAPLANAQAGAAPDWAPPIALTDLAAGVVADSPELAVDDEGRVHVLWYGVLDRRADQGGGLTDTLLYRSRTAGVWSSVEPIYTRDRPASGDTSSPVSSDAAARNPAFALRGSLTSARDSRLHFAVGDDLAQWYFGTPWGEAVRFALLLPPVALGAGADSVIAASAAGGLHTMLTAIPAGAEEEVSVVEGASCDACIEVLYRRSGDGGVIWSRPENLSRLEGLDVGPQVGADAEGRLHTLWVHTDVATSVGQVVEPPYLLYRRSSDDGLSWSEPVRLGAPGEGSLQATLGVGPGGRLLVVYGGMLTGSVFYQSSADGGQTWSLPGLVPDVLSPGLGPTSEPRFALTADGAGRLHLLAAGLVTAAHDGGLQLMHLTWDGQSWSLPVALASGGAQPRNPRLIAERGTMLHAVWSTTDLDVDNVPWQTIWYSSLRVEAPELAPLPTFTPLPTVSPRLAPTAAPTPTPTLLPAEIRRQATVTGPPRWEGEGVTIMFVAFGPVLLLVGGVLWLATRRGRGGE